MTGGRYSLYTAPTVEPVTADEAAEHCRVTEQSEYPYLRSLVTAARQWVEAKLSRQLLSAVWKLYLDDFPAVIELEKPPIITVDSVSYYDLDNVLQTLTVTTDYQTDLVSKDCPGRIMPAYGASWPSVRPSTVNAVVVQFTAGYGTSAYTVPQCIKQAILLLVGHWYERREALVTGGGMETLPHVFEFGLTSLLASESWGAYR